MLTKFSGSYDLMSKSGGIEWDRWLQGIGLLGSSISLIVPDLALKSPHMKTLPLDERELAKSFSVSQREASYQRALLLSSASLKKITVCY